MFGSEIYALTMEDEVDAIAADRHARQLHRVPAAPSPREIAQRRVLRRLEKENKRLKTYMAGLVGILKAKGVLGRREIEALVAEVESQKVFPLLEEPPTTIHHH